MPSSSIQVLPTEVVYLINAGEVIDSFASVVRELVENSLDAGATRIVVSLWPEHWRISVADNGCGMSQEDLEQAALAHSTSKIKSSEDLWKIKTLGFRGEALHSLTTLANLEIYSRRCGGDVGWRVTYGEGGKPIEVIATAIAPGTVVMVSHLFGNCQARRQGLPSAAQQMKGVQLTIQQIALCHPLVTWEVQQNDRQWFRICGTSTMGKLLPQILPQVEVSDLEELNLEISEPPESILNLVVGLPDRCHRRRADWVRVAINGRMIKCPELENSIIAAFQRTLPRDRYPVCLLHLTILPHHINWNRHPAKNEIYLNDIAHWQKQITLAIDQAFRVTSASLKESLYTNRISKLLKAAEPKSGYNVKSQIPKDSNNTNYKPVKPILKAIAQLSNTYIVAEHSNGMWLVEQHIAHERVLYEQICTHWQLVPIENPIIVGQLSPNQVTQLQRIGLDIETFGEALWVVRTIPELLQHRNDCKDAILELSRGGDLEVAQVAVACRSAIRNGTPMTIPEMQSLLDQWQQTRNPRTCPHGRPIYLSLEEPALARFFRRNWVIGKSHGI